MPDASAAASALPPVFTIGHSTRPYAEFVALLQDNAVQCVVDVRKLTGSRRHPQYNADALAAALAQDGIGYQHIAALGGRRGRTLASGVPSPNGFWTNDSFRRYADYAMGEEFAHGLQQLLQLADRQRCALMCAEAVWWRCHRRLVSDLLQHRGWQVLHIVDARAAQEHPGHPDARAAGEDLVYPPRQEGLFPAAD